MNVRSTHVLTCTLFFATAAGSQVLEWPLESPNSDNVTPTRFPSTYVWYYDEDPQLKGYHAGEDWNYPPPNPNPRCPEQPGPFCGSNYDCGSSIKSPYPGSVVPGNSAVGGTTVVVHHTLPDNTTEFFLTYRHCEVDSDHEEGPIGKGDEVCRMGNTGTKVCHMHWELTAADYRSINPWFGNQVGSSCRYSFDLVSSSPSASTCQGIVTLGNYGSPSLLLDDWGSEIIERSLTEDNWSSTFSPPQFVPNAIVFLEYQSGTETTTISLENAYNENYIESIQFLNPSGIWTPWEFDELFSIFSQDVSYKLRLADDNDPNTTNWKLVVPIPGHGHREERALMEMIQWANQDPCNSSSESGCFARLETRSLKRFEGPYQGSDKWDVWSINASVRTTNSFKVVALLYASLQSNPLIRCIRTIDPNSGNADSLWSPIARGKVYTIPNVPLDLTLQTHLEFDNCNEDL